MYSNKLSFNIDDSLPSFITMLLITLIITLFLSNLRSLFKHSYNNSLHNFFIYYVHLYRDYNKLLNTFMIGIMAFYDNY